jgi:hypothetical protein
MNPVLRQLLATAGLGGETVEWSDVLVVRSRGTLPPPANAQAEDVRHRGFNLLLLEPGGTPTHFCKCRPSTDDEAAHETALLEVLCGDPLLRTVLPKTRAARTAEMLLQISAYLPGPTYLREVGQQSNAAWTQAMHEILRSATLLADRATAILPPLVPHSGPVDLQHLGSAPLTDLASRGLTPERAEALEQALARAGCLSRRVQHGDLWPGNILWWAGSWWVLDLARYGWCQVPMYDAYHFVRSCCELRQDVRGSGTGAGWYGQMASGDRVATTARQTLASVAEGLGLTPAQRIGALAYHSVDLTARLIRRHVVQPVWAPLLAHTERLADALRTGEPVEHVFFGVHRAPAPASRSGVPPG